MIYHFLLFFFITQTQTTQTTDLLVQRNTHFLKTLNDTDPIYYLESSSNNQTSTKMIDFCSVQQGKYTFHYYSKVFDQTDSKLYSDQHFMLGIDNYLYVLLKSGNLQMFNVSFQEETAMLYHLNEITLADRNFLEDIGRNRYFGMFHYRTVENLLILTKQVLVFVNINDSNKNVWFTTSYYKFINISEIIYAKFLNDNLYVLRDNNLFEVWNINSNLSVNLIKTVNFSNEFSELKNIDLNIVDFEINEDFFFFLEKTTKSFFLIKYQNSFDNLESKLLKKKTFEQFPILVELTTDKVFILLDTHSSNYFLTEYLINKDFNLSNTFNISQNYLDLYIGDDYYIETTPEYAVLNPHSFVGPLNVSYSLQMIFDVKNLQNVDPFILTQGKNFIPFKLLKDLTLSLMKIQFVPPMLMCNLENVPTGEYSLNFDYYLLPCKDIDFKCNRSNFYIKKQIFNIQVADEKNINEILLGQTDTSEMQTLIIVLVVCLTLALFLLIGCLFYVYKVVKVSNETKVLLAQKEKYVERIMSREEIETIKKPIQISQDEMKLTEFSSPVKSAFSNVN